MNVKINIGAYYFFDWIANDFSVVKLCEIVKSTKKLKEHDIFQLKESEFVQGFFKVFKRRSK